MVRAIFHLGFCLVVSGLLTVPALAQAAKRTPPPPAAAAAPSPPSTPPEPAAIEPAAIERLKAASARLVGAKSLSFDVVVTYEAPARTGQILAYSTFSSVAMRRPDRLRVITPGDGPASSFYYDGKQIIAFAPAAGLAAVAPAPPTIEAALQMADEKAAIYFPFAEMLGPNPGQALTAGLKTAFYMGQSRVVGDTVTDMIAITTDAVHAQFWIGINDGLPRKVRVLYVTDPNRAQNEVVFSNWKMNPPLKDSDFTSAAALAAPRMAFARPDVPLTIKPPRAP